MPEKTYTLEQLKDVNEMAKKNGVVPTLDWFIEEVELLNARTMKEAKATQESDDHDLKTHHKS